jgi:hypothetical protein
LAAAAKAFFEQVAVDRELFVVPPDADDAGRLAARYWNSALGEIAVGRVGPATPFDFGEWKSEVASRHNPDGSVSFIPTSPGVTGFEFVVGAGAKRTLVLRDAQHQYVFDER